MISESRNLLELADCIDAFLLGLKDQTDAMYYYTNLYFELDFYKRPHNAKGYRVFKEEIAAPYLLSNWLLAKTCEKNYSALQGNSERIRKLFKPSSAAIISENSVHKLMGHIQDRFQFCSMVLSNLPLNIIITEDSYEYGNGLVLHNTFEQEYEENPTKRDLVILTRINDNIAPEISFLHELGHILNLRITKQYDKIAPPKSFEPILMKFFPNALEASCALQAEIFADCFVIASLYNSEYSYLDYWPFINDKNKNLIYLYFKILVEAYEAFG